MSKYILFLMLIIGLGAFLYYTTIYEVEHIKINNEENRCDEIIFNPFPVNHAFPTSNPQASKDKNYFNNGILDWQNLGIHNIPDSFFYDYPCIEDLKLEKNELEKIPVSIQFLTNLTALNLANNQFKNLTKKEELYQKLPRFKIIDLTANQLSEFPVGLVSSFQLTNLILDSNQINTFSNAAFYNETSVENIHLTANQIKTFPTSLNRIQNLNHLRLEGNQMQETINLIGFQNLNHLVLKNNNITGFTSDNISRNALRILDLSKNKVSFFEQQKTIYHKLFALYLDDNQLKTFNLSTDIFPELNSLRLNKNQLSEIEILSLFESLSYLDIGENNLTTFSCLKLPNLTYLDIGKNNIKTFLCPVLPKMGHLDISNNQLSKMPENIYKMDDLKILYCNSNNIPGSVKWINSNIEMAYMNNNQIEQVTIKNSPELWNLDLSNNNIKSFSIDKASLKSMKYLKLDHNPVLTEISIDFILKNAPNLSSLYVGKIGISDKELEKYEKVAEEKGIHFFY